MIGKWWFPTARKLNFPEKITKSEFFFYLSGTLEPTAARRGMSWNKDENQVIIILKFEMCWSVSAFTCPAACFAVAHGVSSEAVSVLKVCERFDGPPGLQVAGHADRRPHLQPVIDARFGSVAAVWRRLFGLRTQVTTVSSVGSAQARLSTKYPEWAASVSLNTLETIK